MNKLDEETAQRLDSLVIRRLQTAGKRGLNATEFATMLQAEFEGSLDVNRHRLIKQANEGKIFRKMVPCETGGLTGRFFLTQQDCDEFVYYRSNGKKSEETPYVHPKPAVIPKYSMTERDPAPMELGNGIIIPPHIKVKVCDPYKSDYRIKVDPASIPRNVDSSQCRDWAKA